jgi:rhamnose transport system substrate-binding protein
LKIKKVLLAATAVGLLLGVAGCEKKSEKTRIAMVVKNLGNGFFDAAHQGADEAAKQIGNVEVIYTGPTTPSAEGQIEIINSLISQKVDAIVISANDPNAGADHQEGDAARDQGDLVRQRPGAGRPPDAARSVQR